MIYKILTAILLGVNVLLAYNLNVLHNINTEATQKIKEQNRIIDNQKRIINQKDDEINTWKNKFEELAEEFKKQKHLMGPHF